MEIPDEGASPQMVVAEVERHMVLKCGECGFLYEEKEGREAGPLYECSECSSTFPPQEGSKNLSPCCRKMSPVVAEFACPNGCSEPYSDEIPAIAIDGDLWVTIDSANEEGEKRPKRPSLSLAYRSLELLKVLLKETPGDPCVFCGHPLPETGEQTHWMTCTWGLAMMSFGRGLQEVEEASR